MGEQALKRSIDQQQIEKFILDWIVQRLEISADSIRKESTFSQLGVDSMAAIELAADLETWLEMEIPDTIVWDYPSIVEAAAFLSRLERKG
jgi:acyl carrier protein